ncbi:hypothetical protein EW145_g1601 [Phellinidium pouzarii]|uniref:Protein phosphatase methylesterase 1 n=1 Tax=Phellinidium pouzarii TaxID=167371 RepID=A0A4S4LJG6_9AGAM|nr:hypothetical protein EW145_g1601 [Phellinidium pouzarii]
MSDLYRSAISARIDKLPQSPTAAPYEIEDGEEDEEENDSVASLPSMPPPRSSIQKPKTRKKRSPNPEYSPISAAGYFDQAVEVTVPAVGLNFRVYYSPPTVVGGTVMICHHGAGYSGLSFACFTKEVMAQTNGKTKLIDDSMSDADLSVEVLSRDAYNLLLTLFPKPAETPTFLLVGHSMGGSVLVRTCPMLIESKYRVTGVAVLDVVEGSAIDALPFMNKLLDSRPNGFDSIEEAVEWHVSNHTIRNPQSARISVPSLFVQSESPNDHEHEFKWRTPLRSTAQYWESWFLGLSSKFLAVRAARLLVLAGTDRLDKELMIGQMQGKFQMIVVPDTGHMIHEDNPERLADILMEFWRRNERVVKGVKKVGEL